ncbi:hypothetical protein MC48_006915 [Serratia marcescens]|nr:hypothetical protein MC48_006915 [Serratia marcescens]
MCLGSSTYKVFFAFSLNLSHPDLISINLLVRVQLEAYPGSIMFVPTGDTSMALTEIKVCIRP